MHAYNADVAYFMYDIWARPAKKRNELKGANYTKAQRSSL